MDSKRLRYFIQIVDSGSITRAAAAVGVAQPALSQQLAILEHELKVKLLDRSVSGVTPTAAGQILYASAQAILRQYDEIKRAVHKGVKPLSGTVIIGMLPTMVPRLGLLLVERVCVQHPEMHLQIVEDGGPGLDEYLQSGRIEIAVSPNRPDQESIVGEELSRDELVVALPPDWEAEMSATLEDLAQLPWIVTRSQHSVRAVLDAIFAAKGLRPRIVVEIDSLPNVVELVKRGLGVTLLPASVIESDLASGQLKMRPITSEPVYRRIYVTHRLTPPLSAPAQFVYQALRELSSEKSPV